MEQSLKQILMQVLAIKFDANVATNLTKIFDAKTGHRLMQRLTKYGTEIDADSNTQFDANPYVEINTSIDIRLIKN